MENFRNYSDNPLTVGELKKLLSSYSDDMEIYFEGFIFYRLKQRGDKTLQIELNEKDQQVS